MGASYGHKNAQRSILKIGLKIQKRSPYSVRSILLDILIYLTIPVEVYLQASRAMVCTTLMPETAPLPQVRRPCDAIR